MKRRIELKKGKHRYVIIMEPIVIKIAQIEVRVAYYSWLHWISWLPENENTYINKLNALKLATQDYILRGIMENIREFYYFWKTRSKILAPTYMSLGIINIGGYVEGVGDFDIESGIQQIFDKLLLEFGDSSEYKRARNAFGMLGHTIEDPGNFAINNGQFKIVDYSESDLLDLLENYDDIEEQILKQGRLR